MAKRLAYNKEALNRLIEIRDDARVFPGGFKEACRTFAGLKRVSEAISKSSDFWNVPLLASGELSNSVYLQNGDPIYRLFPNHQHCIALIAPAANGWLVAAICTRSELRNDAEIKIVSAVIAGLT